ncbi:MAG: aquaporin NIP [Candidatus Omnitrophota bacterium]|jgi:aquaporin NIP
MRYNLDMNTTVHKLAAEALGTFTLVFFGCGSIMVSSLHPEHLPPFIVPVIFGLVVACMIYTLGHISGAHFNPAVTFGFALARHFPKKEVLLYWVAQVAGAIAASALLSFLLPNSISHGATLPSVPAWTAFAWEVTLTFFLMFVIMAVATDTRAVGTMAGIAIGAIVGLDAFVGGPITGASMNPARSIAPALFQGTLSSLLIYIPAPMLGGGLGALVYGWIRCDKKMDAKKNAAEGCC